jgi:hypothetical protein
MSDSLKRKFLQNKFAPMDVDVDASSEGPGEGEEPFYCPSCGEHIMYVGKEEYDDSFIDDEDRILSSGEEGDDPDRMTLMQSQWLGGNCFKD